MKIWITWENQRRNREISSKLDIPLFQFDEIDGIRNPAIKYSKGLTRTATACIKHSPKLMICQNPSIVLSFCTVIFGLIFRRKIVIDAHNAGLYPKEGRSRFLMAVSRFIQKYATLTIITNQPLQKEVERNGGRGYVLPDPIPVMPKKNKIALKKAFNVLFICSFAKDEPYMNVVRAAESMDNSVHIYITGNYRKGNVDPSTVSANITLLGFIPENQYVDMLNSVDATIDLTDRENCLVCGAYESVAVEKPMILSNTRALNEFFPLGSVFTDNSTEDLVRAIHEVQKNYTRLSDEIRRLKRMKQIQWSEAGEGLKRILCQLAEV